MGAPGDKDAGPFENYRPFDKAHGDEVGNDSDVEELRILSVVGRTTRSSVLT